MATKGQKQTKYEQSFKEQIIKERLERGTSYRYLAKKHGVPKGTIETWLYQYRQKGSMDTGKRGRRKQDENIDYKEKYEILKKFLGFLEEVDQEKK